MSIEEITKSVRLCYDEEVQDTASFESAAADDNTLMNNIIAGRIGDAIRWICLYAPAELLGGTDEPDTTENGETVKHETGILVDVDTPTVTPISGTTGGTITMPANFIKLARVRAEGWHRAIKTPIEEDSEEYLELRDQNGAAATAERPQAVLIDKAVRELEIWPMGNGAEYTYVADTEGHEFEKVIPTTGGGSRTETHYAIPPRTKTAFVYYLAFLVLSAYEDSRAGRMLEIAKMNLGLTKQ